MSGKDVTVVGEAKWSQQEVNFGILNHLRDTARFVPGWDTAAQVFLFGRIFDGKLASAAGAEGVRLVTPAELFADG